MPSLLNDKDLKKLKNDMKGYTREFEINDRAFSMNQNKEVVERRRSILDAYNKWQSQAQRSFILEIIGFSYLLTC